jgi:hypothetical protein
MGLLRAPHQDEVASILVHPREDNFAFVGRYGQSAAKQGVKLGDRSWPAAPYAGKAISNRFE